MKKLIKSISYQKVSLIMLLILAAPLTSAKVYKWVDENGKIHFSDKPIDDKSKLVKMKRQPTPTEIGQAKERANTLIQHHNKVQEISNEEKRDQLKATQENNKKQNNISKLCRQAKREIILLGHGRVTYTTDQEGKRHYLSDEDKNRNIAKLKKKVQQHCEK